MAKREIPQSVLSEQISDKIGGRRVRTAVFTTFSFDPGFFELNVLPLFFDQPFSQVDKVRSAQLEDCLRTVDGLAVYYDRTALSQDAQPAQLDVRRIGVQRHHGVFHPKVIFVLVDNLSDDGQYPPLQSLIVATLSANLTRSGWWENVEAGEIFEVQDKELDNSRCSFRKDLMDLIRLIKQTAPDGEEHDDLDRIDTFIRDRLNRGSFSHHSARDRYYPRVFMGQKRLSDWLVELRLAMPGYWNMEIISPYFDVQEHKTLQKLHDMIEPRETRVFLPMKEDGTTAVLEAVYNRIAEIQGCYWGELPSELTARGKAERAVARKVHAKVYRLWNQDHEVTLTGSVNLTDAAHSPANAGNLEAAFLVDQTDNGYPRTWWMDRVDGDPAGYAEKQEVLDDEREEVYIDIAFYYDWSVRKLYYYTEKKHSKELEVCAVDGRPLFKMQNLLPGAWYECDKSAADQVGQLLETTSFLRVSTQDGYWRVLVREEGMSHRPTLLNSLTPEEILIYWSLLAPADRAYFLEQRLVDESVLEGVLTKKGERYLEGNTVFSRFSGLYHAFEQLFQHVNESLVQGENNKAEALLFGAKYDSLPVLLEQVKKREESDPIMDYVTFLCARQLCRRIKKRHRVFWDDERYRSVRQQLESQVRHIDTLRRQLPLNGEDRRAFTRWYERMFLKEANQV